MAKEKVFIQFAAGETTEIEFSPDKEIEQVKQEIYANKGFAADSYKLVFSGKCLEDGRTLGDYGVKANSIIYYTERFVVQSIAKKTSFAKTLEGKKIEIEFDSDKTIGAVKNEIFTKEHIPIERQRLIFNGKQPYDNETLGSLNVVSGSIIHLVLRKHELEASLAPSGARRINSKKPPSNRVGLGGAAGFIAGLCLTAGYCLYSAQSKSHLGTSFGSRLLEAASPRVCIGIVVMSTILGAGAACVKGGSRSQAS